MMMGMGLIGWVIMLLFWGGLAAGAVLLARALFPGGSPVEEPRELDALQILEMRYARGEIARDDFMRMKQDLEA
ncbi:MAG TPA: SHOCT domain-containing protein [Chloroflexi bacterium]|nr:SHOCT domain-containing protein [Chloroflexota bacterium]